jgi:hypothetical protein
VRHALVAVQHAHRAAVDTNRVVVEYHRAQEWLTVGSGLRAVGTRRVMETRH